MPFVNMDEVYDVARLSACRSGHEFIHSKVNNMKYVAKV
jgi:hypothetical protein